MGLVGMNKPHVFFIVGILFFFGAVAVAVDAQNRMLPFSCDGAESCGLQSGGNAYPVPPLIQKMIHARQLLAVEKLKKEIATVSGKQKEKNSPKAGKSKKNKKASVTDKNIYRIASTEFLLAVDARDEIKIIRLREILPQARQRGFTFEVLSPEDCDVEYTGGDGINRRFQTVCAGYDEPLTMLGRAMVTMRGKNLFSSHKDIETNTRVVIYSPFADAYVTPEHVAYGDYILQEEIINAAYRRLEELGVLSHAYPGEPVVSVIPKDFMYITAINEHGDHSEFDAWGPDYIRKKVLTTIAENQLGVFPACNSSGACGIVQATNKNNNGTYRLVVRMYPEAHLNPRFPEGAYDPVNATMFVVLLYDYELSKLPDWVKVAYKKDPRSVVLCIATAYHSGGGVARDLCAKPVKNISPDSFQFPKRLQKKHPQLGYYLRKYVALERLQRFKNTSENK